MLCRVCTAVPTSSIQTLLDLQGSKFHNQKHIVSALMRQKNHLYSVAKIGTKDCGGDARITKSVSIWGQVHLDHYRHILCKLCTWR